MRFPFANQAIILTSLFSSIIALSPPASEMVQNGRYEVDLDTGVIISFTPFTGDVNATRLAAEDVEKRSSPASRFDKRVPQVNCFSSDINLSDKKVAVDEISDWIGDSHEMQKNYARSYTFGDAIAYVCNYADGPRTILGATSRNANRYLNGWCGDTKAARLDYESGTSYGRTQKDQLWCN